MIAYAHVSNMADHNAISRTPWTLFIVVFLIAAAVSACLVFVFGRIVDIYTKQEVRMLHNRLVFGPNIPL